MSFRVARRESLELFGVGLGALTGCGGATETANPYAGNGGGTAGDGTAPASGMSAVGTDAAGGPSSRAGGDAGSTAGEGGAGGAAPECEAKNEATAGPYPNLSPLNRRDVRPNTTGVTTPKDGAELVLRIKVMDLDALCAPIEGAVVDIWQCDALGLYAGYGPFATVGQDFLRGYQKTDAQGIAEFLTIFPGAYSGRSIHIHFSIRASEGVLPPNASGSGTQDVFIAQLYFNDTDSYAVFDAYPIYRNGSAITPNGLDGIFELGGHDLLVSLSETMTGYVGEVTVGVSRAAIGI
jgi:protocatechuate 3,4-dioxygenase beta subunit